MVIFSAFDGISVACLALLRAGINVEYYAAEVDPYAIKVSQLNFPDIIQLGDIRNIRGADLPAIDLLIGGSPCQNLSSLGTGKGLEGQQSKLFFEYLRLLNELKPKYFILENVASMSKKERQVITDLMGVEPIMLNSNSLSPQTRKRLYWTNIPGVVQPKNLNLKFQDILSSGFADRERSHALLCNQLPETETGLKRYLSMSTGQLVFREKYFAELSKENKLDRYLNTQKLKLNKVPDKEYKNGVFRHINIQEAERLQTLPEDYTAGISKSQRFKCLGNSFTCDVIAYILSFIPKEN